MRYLSAALLFAALAGCASARAGQTGAQASPAPAQATASARGASADSTSADRSQYPSTYKRHPNPPVVIRNATIMTATGQEIQGGSILFRDGRIVAVGATVEAPADAVVVDGTGKWVTPGVIDIHSHLGDYPSPGVESLSDGNEATSPSRPEVWGRGAAPPRTDARSLSSSGRRARRC